MAEKGSLLEKAIRIAVEAHRGQKDRYGAPYILHPLRVMNRVETDHEKIVALLHDVVEDSSWTLEDLEREGFPKSITSAVDSLTKREGEPYEKLVGRAARNPLARRVKLADLEDNLDARRLTHFKPGDAERFKKYLTAWKRLTNLEVKTS